MNEFMLSQKRRIEHEKWLEGCRLKKDPGADFVLTWIHLNAAAFREAWNNSLCKRCELCTKCGYEAISDCADFKMKNGNAVTTDRE